MDQTPFTLHHEGDATGLVSAVYADIRRRMTFVPAIFKALAGDPRTLEQAWLQARALYDDPAFAESADRLRVLATPTVSFASTEVLRRAVAPFAAELPGLLLIVSSLAAALDGRLPHRSPKGAIEPGDASPEPVVPELRGEHTLYASIRAVYGTAHVPSLYRSLAALDLLEEAWGMAGPLLSSDAGRSLIDRVATAGDLEAMRFGNVGYFGSLEARPILDQFRVALPRNLVVALALS